MLFLPIQNQRPDDKTEQEVIKLVTVYKPKLVQLLVQLCSKQTSFFTIQHNYWYLPVPAIRTVHRDRSNGCQSSVPPGTRIFFAVPPHELNKWKGKTGFSHGPFPESVPQPAGSSQVPTPLLASSRSPSCASPASVLHDSSAAKLVGRIRACWTPPHSSPQPATTLPHPSSTPPSCSKARSG